MRPLIALIFFASNGVQNNLFVFFGQVVAVVQEVHGGGSPKKVTATVSWCILL